MARSRAADEPTLEGLVSQSQRLEARNEQSDAPTPTDAEELKALVQALEGAVALEFATIPPYLTALWSIKEELHPVAISLRNIVQEEMLHLALTCNMLASLKGVPRINYPPVFPAKLPLGVHPELTVPLAGLSPKALDTFLEIERPDNPDYKLWIKLTKGLDVDEPDPATDFTIGQLYDQIRSGFHRLNPSFSADRQMSGPLAWRVVRDLGDIDEAIEIIQQQGEGSWGKPEESRDGHLAHFFRFAEIKELKKLVRDPKTGSWQFKSEIPFDFAKDVWPVADVPVGGYPDKVVTYPEIRRLLHGFNVSYSNLLDLLQSAWSERGGQAMLVRGIAMMFELEYFAKPLMEREKADGTGNYGPEFRYLPAKER